MTVGGSRIAVRWLLGVQSCWHDRQMSPGWWHGPCRRLSRWCGNFFSLDHGHEWPGRNVWVATVRKLLHRSGRLDVISFMMRWVGVWNISPSAWAVSLLFDWLVSLSLRCLLRGTVRLVSGKTLAVMSRISIVATPTPIRTKTARENVDFHHLFSNKNNNNNQIQIVCRTRNEQGQFRKWVEPANSTSVDGPTCVHQSSWSGLQIVEQPD